VQVGDLGTGHRQSLWPERHRHCGNHQRQRSRRSGQAISEVSADRCRINPGNSGGPLVDLAGEVIGINTAIITGSRGYEGVGFALPSSVAINVITN